MVPICMVNEETLAQIPEDVRLYLRTLRRRIIELEQTEPQQRIAELEAANRSLQVELDDALATIAQQQQQIRQLQQQLADATAKLNTNSSNSSLPPSSDRFRVKRRPPPPPDQPRKKSGGQPGHPRHQRLLVLPDQVQPNHPLQTHGLSPLRPAPDGSRPGLPCAIRSRNCPSSCPTSSNTSSTACTAPAATPRPAARCRLGFRAILAHAWRPPWPCWQADIARASARWWSWRLICGA